MKSTVSEPLPFRTLVAAVAAGVSIAAGSAQGRAALPFDVFPGVIYLGFLGVPMAFRPDGTRDAAPDLQFGVYFGPAHTSESAVKLSQPNGTDLSFEGVAWEGKTFRPPPYYGYRGIYWLPAGGLGAMVDFTHIKAISVKDRTVRVTGTRDGSPVAADEPLTATFKRLEFTHGYNLLTFNLLKRGRMRGRGLMPYAGAGIGAAIPHVEMQRAGAPVETRTYEYQVTGPAFQALAGLEWRFGQRLALFVEYKLSCAAIRGDLRGGGTIATDLCTHQILGGPALHLRPRGEALP